MSENAASSALPKIDSGFSSAFIALVFGAIAMGASPIFVRFAASEVSPFASAFWRVALALPVLYGWMCFEDKRQPQHPNQKKYFSKFPVLAGLAFTGDLFFWHLSILNTSVANATFFATFTPVYIIAITFFVFKQAISRSALIGVLFCLSGGAVLVSKTMSVNPESLKGDVFGLITALFFSLYFLSIGFARQRGESPARITFMQTTVTAIALFLIALIHSVLTGQGFFPSSRQGVLSLIGLALVSQVAGQGLLTISLGRLPTVFSSLIIFLEAIAAALLGWLFLDEMISLAQCIGGLFILIGIWIARPPQEKSHLATEKQQE